MRSGSVLSSSPAPRAACPSSAGSIRAGGVLVLAEVEERRCDPACRAWRRFPRCVSSAFPGSRASPWLRLRRGRRAASGHPRRILRRGLAGAAATPRRRAARCLQLLENLVVDGAAGARQEGFVEQAERLGLRFTGVGTEAPLRIFGSVQRAVTGMSSSCSRAARGRKGRGGPEARHGESRRLSGPGRHGTGRDGRSPGP